MEKKAADRASQALEYLLRFLRKCIFSVLSVGPVPAHIAFIMDGNRRYGKKYNLLEGAGHRSGYLALMNMLKYCYEMGANFVTIYAFSIDNFKRRPEEVQSTMLLIQEKIEELMKEESMVNHYGVRIYFIGNLKLLSQPVRLAAERAMTATAGNSKVVLSICLAYTSTDEIAHAVQECCEEKLDDILALETSGAGYGLISLTGNEIDQDEDIIDLADIERHMYAAVMPDPNIIIRTSGETRLSNFLLWQSSYCLLYSPSVLWPEIGFRHLVWAFIDFQRNFTYLKKKREQSGFLQLNSPSKLAKHFMAWSVDLLTVLQFHSLSLQWLWPGLGLLFAVVALSIVIKFLL